MSALSKISGVKLASPSYGRSLAGTVAPIREKVLAAVQEIAQHNCIRSSFFLDSAERDVIKKAHSVRFQWLTVNIVLLDWLEHSGSVNAHRALTNFFVESEFHNTHDLNRIIGSHINGLRKDVVKSLLPYLLDPYGKTSRLDVIKDQSKNSMRKARKNAGSFYTPQDVAEYMVSKIAGGGTGKIKLDEVWFDPAVGSGVFLATVLKLYRDAGASSSDIETLATTRLFGADISPLACDFSVFTIMAALPEDSIRKTEKLFSRIRQNFIAVDATELSSKRKGDFQNLLPVGFPVRLICNPPYTKLPDSNRISAVGPKSLYVPFVEMKWSLPISAESSCAFVLPLAVGANRSKEHQRLRREIVQAGGEWSFLFFDRQPHALFGEDAKTRATILINNPAIDDGEAQIKTSRLLKWRSSQRSEIFELERTVALRCNSIERTVPKLGSDEEAVLYNKLRSFRLVQSEAANWSKIQPHGVVGRNIGLDLFVGGTAYNYLNVFRGYPQGNPKKDDLSTSPLHMLNCSSLSRANELTALLSSQITFWLWHVECDGFHVPAWFLNENPIVTLNYSNEQMNKLQILGANIWAGLKKDMVLSRNRGKTTFSFRPTFVNSWRRQVDLIILNALGLPLTLCETINDFVENTVSADVLSRSKNQKEFNVGT